MHIPDSNLAEINAQGYTIVENFLEPELLEQAQAALWGIYPKPKDYFANPTEHERIVRHQFAGMTYFPFAAPALNQITVHPDLVDGAERFCGTTDLDIYKVELWAKYSGAVDYDQPHHRDYGNHNILVPQKSSAFVQMTTFVLLSDVTELDGPTKVVPSTTHELPLVPREFSLGEHTENEISITGKAGTLFIYKTDVLHRGSSMIGHERSRFAMLIDFKPRGLPWTGKMAWPDYSLRPSWNQAMINMTPRERCLFGFPEPGNDYWDEETIRDVGMRYASMDMTPYQSKV